MCVYTELTGTIVGIVFALVALVAISAGIFTYRKRKMDMEQQMLAWRVLYEDIEFMGAVTASTGSTAVISPSFSAY